jgi:hypothetical protein
MVPNVPYINYEEGDEIGIMSTELDIDGESGPPKTVVFESPSVQRDTHTRVDDRMATEYDPSSPREAQADDEPDSDPPPAPQAPVHEASSRPPGATKPVDIEGGAQTPQAPSTEADTEPQSEFPVIAFDIGSLDDMGMNTRPPLPDFFKQDDAEDAPTLDIDLSELDTHSPRTSGNRPTELDAGYTPSDTASDEDEDDETDQ